MTNGCSRDDLSFSHTLSPQSPLIAHARTQNAHPHTNPHTLPSSKQPSPRSTESPIQNPHTGKRPPTCARYAPAGGTGRRISDHSPPHSPAWTASQPAPPVPFAATRTTAATVVPGVGRWGCAVERRRRGTGSRPTAVLPTVSFPCSHAKTGTHTNQVFV